MTSKIFRSTVFVAVVVLLCSLSVVMGVMYKHFSQVQVERIKDELSLAATGTEQYGISYLENVEAERFQITWISSDGTVLFDTRQEQAVVEDLSDREEVREALRTGTGSAVHASSALTEQTYYEAQRLEDGTVLRISTSQKSAWFLIIGMLWPTALIAFVAIGLSAFLARRMANKIVEPLNTLDLEQPLKNDVYEEISPLLHRIHRQHNQIAAQLDTMRRKTDEFEQITGNMQEGLVLLDSEAAVLSINPAAMRLFDVKQTCVGRNFLMIDRSGGMRNAVNDALDKGRGFTRENRNGRDYQFDLSRIQSDGTVIGAVVLAFDITERLNAEQLRREFSANVSHELKTPLQGIIGSSELMENGMVKAEDVPRFAGLIRKEAVRLVHLIEDIIRLSQLDEGVTLPTEDVDMLALAGEVITMLEPGAAEKDVRLILSGGGFSINGVRRLLHEILYNLCENAIKYNVPGGSVRINVEQGKLTVSDTGIGIPLEHQGRIFERFYRVDKSHSKQSGGTGLGLSIVKHAVSHHKASLALESNLGKGTTITVTFHKTDRI